MRGLYTGVRLGGVKWTSGSSREDVEDRRGMRVSRRGMAIGGAGGVVVVVVYLVARAFGVDLSSVLGSNSSSSSQTQSQQAPLDPKNDPNAQLADFVVFAFNDVQATFAKQLAEQHPYNGE